MICGKSGTNLTILSHYVPNHGIISLWKTFNRGKGLMQSVNAA